MNAILPARFINYRREWDAEKKKWQKIPCDPHGMNIDPHQPGRWMSHDEASKHALWDESKPAMPYGVGFVFNGDGWFLLDLDDALAPDGTWKPDADLLFRSFTGVYGEVSTSGNGLHIIGMCDPSQLEDRRNKWNGDREFYTDGRFVALAQSGLQMRGDAIVDQTPMLLRVVPQREFLGDLPDGRDPAYTGPEDDDELIRMMLRSRGGAAAAFGGGLTVAQLWNVDAVAVGQKYPDPVRPYDASAADMALMTHLAFWTGKDMPRMVRLARRSGLVREKWDKHPTYLVDTIQKGARLCKKVYDKPFLPSAVSDNAVLNRKSTFFTASSLQGRTVQTREWLVPQWIPDRTVSLLSGDGGTGKSLLALQLAVAVATGSQWLGMSIQQAKVIYFSAEDDEDELHRRLSDVLAKNFIGFEHCEGLTLRSLAGEDALLANEHNNALSPSELMDELDQRAELDNPALIVVDTLADVFPSNENDRAKVRHFVGMLRGLAIRRKCAVLLLSHPSQTGLISRSGTSGSTAWNNSVRARLYLERSVQNGEEVDPNVRVLSMKKSNYSQIGTELRLRWIAGCFVADGANTSSHIGDLGAKAERVFMKLLGEFEEQGRTVNPNSGSNYGPTVFSNHPDNEGITKRAFKLAMESLLKKRRVVIDEKGPPSKRSSYLKSNDVLPREDSHDDHIVAFPMASPAPSPPLQLPLANDLQSVSNSVSPPLPLGFPPLPQYPIERST